MSAISHQREIVDRSALNARLADFIDRADRAPSSVRADILAMLKSALADGRAEIRRRFDGGASGADTVRAHSFLIDQLLRVIYDFAADWAYPAANPTSAERLCLAAVGGYGRGELAPHSDIDLLFLLPYKETPRLEQVIEYVLYMLWDLGLKVGHATRSTNDSIRLSKEDLTIRTATLEARYLWGDKKLYNELRRRFEKEISAASGPEFVEAKLAERAERHRRMGDSRYVLEPNIKDGKGGLRDLQTLFWIAKDLYRVDEVDDLVQHRVLTTAEARRFDRAQNFMWNVRCQLHYIAGRGEDRLTFDLQTPIGEVLGYRDHAGTSGVERFMKHYYLVAKEVGDLTRIFCAALESEHRRRPAFAFPIFSMFHRAPEGFRLDGGRLRLASGERFADEPIKIMRLFHEAQARDLDIHPRPLRTITRDMRLVDGLRNDPEANRLFMEMLTSPKDPETTLRRLNEAGVFGRFIPDFGRVVAQMQHDMYHVYTVDEHTIFAIGILHGIENGEFTDEMPTASEVVHNIQSRRVLYFATLMHDIAKGRGGDHSVLGAEVAERLGPRLGLSAEETETASWLVRYHLVMSNTAFRRDINDPKTISDFAETVQSLERLRLLLVLTVADIRAVGPNVWNGWKASLLRELYKATEDHLSGGHTANSRDRRVEVAQQAFRAAALASAAPDSTISPFTEDEIDAQIALGYPAYWLGGDTQTHLFHAGMMRNAARNDKPLNIETRIDEFRDVTKLTLYAQDHPGLFSRIAGAMAVSGANIVDAKIFTMTNGMALDTFSVQDLAGKAIRRSEQLDRLAARIRATLAGELRPARELAEKIEGQANSRTRVFTVAPRVLIDDSASRTFTVLEVNGRDRPGLLCDLTRTLTALNLQIGSARIATYGEAAVDVFYVKDVFGLKITHEGKLAQIHAALLAVMENAPEPESEPGMAEKLSAAGE
jgi:[protein-PII] uridylyltransferase